MVLTGQVSSLRIMVFCGKINRKRIIRRMTMEGLEIYDFLRLVFITFIISLIVILLIQKKRSNLVNGFTVSITSITSIIVSGINLIIMGYIADELNLGGDVISSYLFLIILGLSIFNLFIYFKNKNSFIGA
jgi:Mg/Co/Ni transporter MgtE